MSARRRKHVPAFKVKVALAALFTRGRRCWYKRRPGWTSGLMCAKSYGSEFEGITIHRMICDSMRVSPLFSEVYPLLSEKRPFFFTGIKREGAASETCQKTRLTINVRKSGGAASF
jgi:hypothetical protein